jgi:hypothetical protein
MEANIRAQMQALQPTLDRYAREERLVDRSVSIGIALMAVGVVGGVAICLPLYLKKVIPRTNVWGLVTPFLVGALGVGLCFVPIYGWNAQRFDFDDAHVDHQRLQQRLAEVPQMEAQRAAWEGARQELETALSNSVPGLEAPVQREALLQLIQRRLEQPQATEAWQAQQLRLGMLEQLLREKQEHPTSLATMQADIAKWQRQLGQIR